MRARPASPVLVPGPVGPNGPRHTRRPAGRLGMSLPHGVEWRADGVVPTVTANDEAAVFLSRGDHDGSTRPRGRLDSGVRHPCRGLRSDQPDRFARDCCGALGFGQPAVECPCSAWRSILLRQLDIQECKRDHVRYKPDPTVMGCLVRPSCRPHQHPPRAPAGESRAQRRRPRANRRVPGRVTATRPRGPQPARSAGSPPTRRLGCRSVSWRRASTPDDPTVPDLESPTG